MTLNKIIFPMLLVMLLVGLSGCSSKAKKEAKDEAAESVSAMDEQINLELNADSDSMSVGPIQTVYFPFDSSVLTSTTKAVLKDNANFLKLHSKIEIQIEGHCDERGGVEYNMALGERRATAVRQYLIALGIDSSRITTISYGKERPLAFGHDEESWSKNRRGNFVITAK